MTERLYDTKQAAAELGIPALAIRTWKHRGKVIPGDFIRGSARGGLVPLYHLDDLRPLAEAYLARRADTP